MKDSCGFFSNIKRYKYADIMLNTYYMKTVPCLIKTDMSSSSNMINLETKYNNTYIKLIDVQQNNLSIDYVYPMSILLSIPSAISNPNTKSFMHDIIFNVYNYLKFLDTYGIDYNINNLIILCNINNFDNAFWNGHYLCIGNGTYCHTALTTRMIIGHEITHSLIDTVCHLKYEGLSGALNEAFADIFGVSFEFFVNKHYPSLGWQLGSETGRVLRNMSDPEKCQQPRRVGGLYYVEPTSHMDNGGVHINSGIINHIFYVIHNLIGWESTFILFTGTLYKLYKDSTFRDFRYAIISANNARKFIDLKKLLDILNEHGIN